ncbi:cytochrome c biogenesis CcdA family protein [Rosettibacter primus]|uniref:cytochrome c biogenesis CcdA family protein n=1 Tax=Rosettibacter primus TaxID=3111523 RepID=UPI00336BC4F8
MELCVMLNYTTVRQGRQPALASFGWGVLSILLSPCHLSSIPLVISYITSQGKISLKRTFYISLIFAIGILITIAVIRIITASLGRLMGDIGATGNYLVAGIFFLVGLYLLDIIKLDWNTTRLRQRKILLAQKEYISRIIKQGIN